MHATTAEILEAYQNLSPNELRALHRFAQRNLSGVYTEPLDLIHEALHRSLEGRRNWPPGLPFAIYMVQTMKSIVGHEREKAQSNPSRAFSMDTVRDVNEPASSWSSIEEQVLVFEQIELARKAAERAKHALTGDDIAQRVLEGMLAGLSPRETCDHFGMSVKEFDAARHRVMRRLRDGALH